MTSFDALQLPDCQSLALEVVVSAYEATGWRARAGIPSAVDRTRAVELCGSYKACPQRLA